MNRGLLLLMKLDETGYFAKSDYDPRPVFDVCDRYLGIDVSTERGNHTFTELVSGLVGQGHITFMYSPDPNLHPKDMLDYWRITRTESVCQRSRPPRETMLPEQRVVIQRDDDVIGFRSSILSRRSRWWSERSARGRGHSGIRHGVVATQCRCRALHSWRTGDRRL
jgi:hypothetical protein